MAKCPNCGDDFRKGLVNTRTCGKRECADAWRTRLRYKHPETKHLHMQAKARHVLAHPEKHGERRLEWARAVLSDTGPPAE